MANPVEIFTIRLWREKLDERRSEWRGKGQDPSSGPTRYFNEKGEEGGFISDHLLKFQEGIYNTPGGFPRKIGPRIRYPLKHRSRRGSAWLEKRPPAGQSPDFRSAGSYSARPFYKEGGDRRLLRRFGHWLKSHTFVRDGMRPLKKSLVLLMAILIFVGDWVQVSWLGPRLHSFALRPEPLFLGLMGLPRSIKLAGGKARRFLKRRRHDKNHLI